MPSPTPISVSAPPLEMRVALPLSVEQLVERIDAAIASGVAEAVRERLADGRVISLAEAVAMTPWTPAGFKRVATKENLPFVKGPHKSPPGYRLGEVVRMLERMQVWPNGKPQSSIAARFRKAGCDNEDEVSKASGAQAGE